MKKKEIKSVAKGAEKLVRLSEKLSGGDVHDAVRMIQFALYSFKVQENADIPPPYDWH